MSTPLVRHGAVRTLLGAGPSALRLPSATRTLTAQLRRFSVSAQRSSESITSNTLAQADRNPPVPPPGSGVSRSSASTNAPTPASAPSATTIQPPFPLPTPHEPALVHPRTHGHHVATLQLRANGPGQSLQNLTFFTDFALRSAYALGIPASRPASLPVRKELWTVPKGPFVHKKSQENFQRRTHKRVIKLWDANDDVVERWLHWLRIHAMEGVAMRAEVFRSYPLGVGSQLLAQARSQLRSSPAPSRASALPGDSASQSAAATTQTARADDVEAAKRLAQSIVEHDLDEQQQEQEQEQEQQAQAPPGEEAGGQPQPGQAQESPSPEPKSDEKP